MKRTAGVLLCGLATLLLCGCATKLVESWAQQDALAAGYRLNPEIPGVLRAPEGSAVPGLSARSAAWQFERWSYLAANIVDGAALSFLVVKAGEAIDDAVTPDEPDEPANQVESGGGDVTIIYGDGNTVSSDRSQIEDN